MRTDILDQKENLILWISQKLPKSLICKNLNCRPGTLNSWLKKLNLEYEGQMNAPGTAKGNHYRPASLYLNKTRRITSSKLKEKLFREGLKERKCESCGLDKWMDSEVPLELHHINGDHFDNEWVNLQVLCPNCHALTENYCKSGLGD